MKNLDGVRHVVFSYNFILKSTKFLVYFNTNRINFSFAEIRI